jgi:hypothetical protein
LPFGGLSALLALTIRAAQWVGAVLAGIGAVLLATTRRRAAESSGD